jgi:hypothetical protein
VENDGGGGKEGGTRRLDNVESGILFLPRDIVVVVVRLLVPVKLPRGREKEMMQ